MKEEGYLTQWMDKLRADALAVGAAASKAKDLGLLVADRRYWFALASGDPDHLEYYAIAGGYDHGFLREFLNSIAGAKLGIAFEAQLERSGELGRWKESWMLPEARAVLKSHIAGESVSVLIKFMESVGKQKGAGEYCELVYIPPFEGSAADLIALLTDSAPSSGSLPFTKSRTG